MKDNRNISDLLNEWDSEISEKIGLKPSDYETNSIVGHLDEIIKYATGAKKEIKDDPDYVVARLAAILDSVKMVMYNMDNKKITTHIPKLDKMANDLRKLRY